VNGAAPRLDQASAEQWRSPIDGRRFDTYAMLRSEESEAITALGVVNLRRLHDHDASAPGWGVISRLLVPMEAVNAGRCWTRSRCC